MIAGGSAEVQAIPGKDPPQNRINDSPGGPGVLMPNKFNGIDNTKEKGYIIQLIIVIFFKSIANFLTECCNDK